MKKFAAWDFVYAVNMAIACGISYAVITQALFRFVARPDDLLAGMWAVVATVFVFRDSRANSLSAGFDRLLATCVSFALCLAYLLIFPFTPVGMAVVVGLGTVTIALLDRRNDIVITGITSVVVLVVAGLAPDHAWRQPILRLVDTVVGIAVGVACKWIGSFVFYRAIREPAR
jgi:uncharacterized membrane protein YgaE (UPF0421/DUF939 family)